MDIRAADPADDPVLARHYLALWDSYGTPQEHYRPDALQKVLDFIRAARAGAGFGAFLALHEGKAVGSVACQSWMSPFPEVVARDHRHFGYVWSVYVEPDHQRKGIAKELMAHALGHLRDLGCTTAVLHSSAAGRKLYEGLGFEVSGEMRLPLG